jgi:hypothetical protein
MVQGDIREHDVRLDATDLVERRRSIIEDVHFVPISPITTATMSARSFESE